MATFEDIRAKTIGRHFEVDGCYPYECWDYYAQYCIELGIPYAYLHDHRIRLGHLGKSEK